MFSMRYMSHTSLKELKVVVVMEDMTRRSVQSLKGRVKKCPKRRSNQFRQKYKSHKFCNKKIVFLVLARQIFVS